MSATVATVSRSFKHHFSKNNEVTIRLIAGSGVEGDVHAGAMVKHRYSRTRGAQINLRQVHLIPEELLDELRASGFEVWPGALGDNINTRGIDLIALPESSLLHIGEAVVLRVTGLRAPCRQMDKFASGLVAAVIGRPDKAGKRKSRAGVMAVVIVGGEIKSGDRIRVEIPDGEFRPLKNV
jgi:hypothetical protein